MNKGDKFYSDINGGIEVTVIDTLYCGEDTNTQEVLLICIGGGLLLKYLETTKYYLDEVITEKPEYIGCIDSIKNLEKYEGI